jgi:hypothetical protein
MGVPPALATKGDLMKKWLATVSVSVLVLTGCDPGRVVELENGCGIPVEWRTSGNDRGTGSNWGVLSPDEREEVSSIHLKVDLLVRIPDDTETTITIPWADYQEIADSAESLLRLEGDQCPEPAAGEKAAPRGA